MNTKQQGNIGIGEAIAYYTKNKYTVSIPLNDSQEYDLIVDNGEGLKKVQVKTTRYKIRNKYVVQLKTAGGTSGKIIKKFNGNNVDYLFILTNDNDRYNIPSILLENGSSLSLGDKWIQYKV